MHRRWTWFVGSVVLLTLAAPVTRAATPGGASGLDAALANYAKSRSDSISVGVWDETTGRELSWRAPAHYDSASIVKVNILETVLWRAQRAHRWLTAWEQQQAVPIMSRSDNDAATRLWNSVGGSKGVMAYDRAVGLRATVFDPGGHWGLTSTTAGDQVRLLRAIGNGPGPLSSRSRAYVRSRMQSVEADQRWGVSAGVPRSGTVQLKNGWLPRATHGWRVNSIGHVRADGRDYEIAVLTTDNSTMSYGVTTIEGISRIVWKALAPTGTPRPPPTLTPTLVPTPGPSPQPTPTTTPTGTPTPTASGTPGTTDTPTGQAALTLSPPVAIAASLTGTGTTTAS